MSLVTLSANEALQAIDQVDAVIDARSEAEYALDHLPGAVNWPTLNNAERVEVGTLYKQSSPFLARKRGAALAARNIAMHIDRELGSASRDWTALTYCWRGGQRSGSLSWVLSQIGFRVQIIDGGYKAFRAAMINDIDRLSSTLRFRVICGLTGTGKTRLLQALRVHGAQVLDLEELANHRSSVLGAVPGQSQPPQKQFDSRIWNELRRFDASQLVYVESESKKVGNLSVPASLVAAMRQSECIKLELPHDSRIALLLEDYQFMTQDVEYFCQRLAVLEPLKGKKVVSDWQAQARSGEFAAVVTDLLVNHYDPAYLDSIERNFPGYAQAICVSPESHSQQSMQLLAQRLLRKNLSTNQVREDQRHPIASATSDPIDG